MGLTKLGWTAHRFPMPEFFPFITEVELQKGSTGIRARRCGQGQMEMHFTPSKSREKVKRTLVLHEGPNHEVEGLEVVTQKRVRINGKRIWVFIGNMGAGNP